MSKVCSSIYLSWSWRWGRWWFHEICDKLVCDDSENDQNTKNLHEVSGVRVEDDAESNSEDFSRSDDKRYKMLFELFDHSVDKHLTSKCQDSHEKHVENEEIVSCYEGENILELPEHERVTC